MHMKDLYSKNYKMLMKETKEDINRWKDIPHIHGLQESILSKGLYHPKQSTDSMQCLSN